MPTVQKEETIAELKEILQQSTGAILTEYRGLSVADLTVLRKKLREVDGEFHIVKNTLFKRAADGVITDEALIGYLEGPTAVGFARKDAVAVTKALLDYAKDHKAMTVKGGVMDGKVYNADEMVSISKLPSKETLISMMLGSLNSPIASLVGTLAGITANFVYTLQAIADKKATEPEPAPKPAVETPVAAATVAEVPVVETPVAKTASVVEAAAPVTETPAAEVPVAETAPVAEAPVAEAVAETPVVETAPVVETPVAEAAPVAEADAPVVETPATEPVTPDAAPVTENSVADTAPTPEATPADESVPTEPAAEAPAAEAPVAEAPADEAAPTEPPTE